MYIHRPGFPQHMPPIPASKKLLMSPVLCHAHGRNPQSMSTNKCIYIYLNELTCLIFSTYMKKANMIFLW